MTGRPARLEERAILPVRSRCCGREALRVGEMLRDMVDMVMMQRPGDLPAPISSCACASQQTTRQDNDDAVQHIPPFPFSMSPQCRESSVPQLRLVNCASAAACVYYPYPFTFPVHGAESIGGGLRYSRISLLACQSSYRTRLPHTRRSGASTLSPPASVSVTLTFAFHSVSTPLLIHCSRAVIRA